MNILHCFDSFKGSLSAREIGACLADAMPMHQHRIIELADGGEGSLASVRAALGECVRGQIDTVDSLSNPCQAPYLLHKGTLYLETAQIIGLPQVPTHKRNPLLSSSIGVGLCIRRAPEAERIVIALGGTATVDGGLGMAIGLGYRFLDARGRVLPPQARSMPAIERIIPPTSGLALPPITGLVDVENQLLGDNGAVYCYAPQKGAPKEILPFLEGGMRHLCERATFHDAPKRGAAGGLAAGLETFVQASLQSGAPYFMSLHHLSEHIRWADVVFSGEGSVDAQTKNGKLLWHIATACSNAHTPLIIIAGQRNDGWKDMLPYCSRLYTLSDVCTLSAAMSHPRRALQRIVPHIHLSH